MEVDLEKLFVEEAGIMRERNLKVVVNLTKLLWRGLGSVVVNLAQAY